MSEATGSRFEIVQPHYEGQLPITDLQWFIRCRGLDDIKRTPYLNTVWKQRDGPITLESLAFGDTMDWIDSAYGDEEATRSLDMSYDFSNDDFKAEFRRRYPLVYQRIQTYEAIAAEVSRRRRVTLELKKNGSKGIVTFTLAVLLKADSKSLATRIKAAVEALKEAYQQAEREL